MKQGSDPLAKKALKVIRSGKKVIDNHNISSELVVFVGMTGAGKM